MSNRKFAWDDEARVITYPEMPAAPHYHADLAACVARAIEIAGGQPRPEKIEIEHASGFIGMAEIEALAKDPSFPDPAADRLQTDSAKP